MTLPYTFVNATPINAADVNSNFIYLDSRLPGGQLFFTPQMYGAGTTSNDLSALRSAINAAAAVGAEVWINTTLSITCASATDPIQMPSQGVKVCFKDGGKINYGTFGLPLFWDQNGTSPIIFDDPWIVYSGTATAALPAANAAFQTLLNRGAYSSNPSDLMAAFLFLGSRDVQLRGNVRFEAAVMSLTNLFPRCISIGTGNTGQRPRVQIGDVYLDGVLMGILAWTYDLLKVRSIYSDRWGQLDTAVYTWDVPCHAIYCTPQNSQVVGAGGYSTTTILGNSFDLGTMVAGSTTTLGSTSFKFTGNQVNLQVGNLWSLRDAGVLDFNAQSFDIGDVWSKSTTAATYAANNMIRLGATGSQDPAYLHGPGKIGKVTLQIPSDAAGVVVELGGLTRGDLDITMLYDGDGTAMASNPFIRADTQDSNFNLKLVAPSLSANLIPIRFDTSVSTGDDNRVTLLADCTNFNGLRVVENNNNKGSSNTARLIDARTGSERNMGAGGEAGVKYASQTLTATAGATLTATSLIPQGGVLMGVTTYVAAALGTTSGLTGYQVGTGSSATRFGTVTGSAIGVGTNNSNWTSGTVDLQTSNLSIILTATGGNFDGTGSIIVRATYFTAARNGDLQ